MKHRKKNWFDLGVSALQRHFPNVPVSYVCPLCLMSFQEDEIDQLTFEHVPPRSLGGRKLVLTCRDCNNRASEKDGVDTHARKRENILDFVMGTLNSSHRTLFTVSNINQEVRVIRNAGGMLISGVPKANPPNRGQEIQQELESMSSDDQTRITFNISLNRDAHSERSAAISWLRAGYLAAFAAFGYKYILGLTFQSVRDQIAKPRESIVSGFSIIIPRAEPRERQIALITDPPWLHALAIQMGRHLVFLPLNNGDETFYDRLRADTKESVRIAVKARLVVKWPEAPIFACDFN